jgi:hypothetical protein
VFVCYATLGKLKHLCYFARTAVISMASFGKNLGFRRASIKRKLMRIQAAILLTFTRMIRLVFVCYATLGKLKPLNAICAVIVVASQVRSVHFF